MKMNTEINIRLLPLIQEAEALKKRFELSKTVGDDYYNPGMMEYLDQSYGEYNKETGVFMFRFESKGTRYEGRNERMERVKKGDSIIIERDSDNPFNSSNFMLYNDQHENLGTLPASLCNALAPLYDSKEAIIEKATVSFIEPLSKRGRYAKQAMMFVEMHVSVSIQ